MKRILLAALVLCLPWPLSAQNAITQEGTVLQNSPMMFRGNNRARQGAPVGGAPSGQTVTTGDSVVGGRCDYSAPIDASDGYYFLCLDANNNTIRSGGTKLPQKPLTLDINGTLLTVPLTAAIVGSDAVVGGNAGLKAAVGAVGKRMVRLGFATPGDGGLANYNWSDSNCTAADDGAQVQPTATGCWIADLWQSKPSIRIWGADPTGATDVAPALLKACTAAQGRTVWAPAGIYWINTAYVQNSKCDLEGDGWTEQNTPSATNGTWFKVTNPLIKPVTFSSMVSKGSHWRNFGVYEQHPTPVTGWAPTAYQPFFSVTDVAGEIEFSQIMLHGVNKGFDIAGAGRFTGNHIHGQCFTYCFQIDNSLDVNRLDDIHIWPYWNYDASVEAYQQANSNMIVTKRNDSPQWGRLFGYGMKSCVKMDSSGSGQTTGLSIDSLACDASVYGLWVTGNNSDGRIATAYLTGEGPQTPNSAGIYIEAQGYTIGIGQARIFYQGGYAINATNGIQGGILSISTLLLQEINTGGTVPAAIHIANTVTPSTAHIFKVIAQPQLNNSGNLTMVQGSTNAFMRVPGYESIVNVLSNGGGYPFANGSTSMYLYTNVGTVASASVILPNAYPDAEVVISTSQTITALTISNGPGESWNLIGLPTTLPANTSVRIRWVAGGSLSTGSWVRM